MVRCKLEYKVCVKVTFKNECGYPSSFCGVSIFNLMHFMIFGAAFLQCVQYTV